MEAKTRNYPYTFAVIDNITAKIGRNTSVVQLNVTNNKNQIFLQKHVKNGTISKMHKNSKNALLSA